MLRNGVANVHLCQVAQDNCDVGDLRSVGRMLKEIVEGSNRVPDNREWIGFYKVAMKELTFKEYRDVLPELLERYWPPHGGSMKIVLRRTDFVELPTLLVRGSVTLSNGSFNLFSLCRLVYGRRHVLSFERSGL